MISILKAPPFTTVQDLGRTGYLASAVPRAGALDPVSLAGGNLLVGNAPDAAGLECGIGRGEIGFERDATVALTGATVGASVAGQSVESGRSIRVAAGESLSIDRVESGAWLYIAISGGIDVPRILGSRSTYVPAGFGGFEGRLLRAGDRLALGTESRSPPSRALPPELASLATQDPIRLLPGPDRELLEPESWDCVTRAEYSVSRAVSRMGYRLSGGDRSVTVASDLPSSPACIGTLQLPSGGEPIVLLCDGPTVGGYARVAVVATVDLGRFAQRRPGDRVRFRVVHLEDARGALRAQRELLDRLGRGA